MLSQCLSRAVVGQARVAVESWALRVVGQLVLWVLLVVTHRAVVDRLDTRQPLLSGGLPVQADGVRVEPEQSSDQAAEVALPTVRCGSRVKKKKLNVFRPGSLAWA